MPTELADAAGAARNAARLDLLGAFLLGYVAILATPGPNLLAVASIAALRGLRGALPVCLGVACGAGALGAALHLAAGTATAGLPGREAASRVAAALLLIAASALVVRLPRPPDRTREDAAPGRLGAAVGRVAAFGAGFCTAATNPLTGAFFTAQFLGPLSVEAAGATALLALLGIVATALVVMLGAAALLSCPVARRAALAWHGPVRITVAAALLSMGVATLWPALSP